MNRLIRHPSLLALALAILTVPGRSRTEEPATSAVPSHYERILREKRIEPTAAGLLRYFRALHPDEAYRRRVAQLVEDLGSTESFAKREAAMAQLLALPRPPREALTAAMSGTDPEVRWRAKQILETATPESERVLYAALRVVEEKKPLTPAPLPSGERGWGEGALAAELIRAVPLCDKPHLVYAVGEALQAVARPNDAQTLRGALESKNAEVRVAAVGALGKAMGRKVAFSAVDCFRLPNGNTLITGHLQFLEVTPDKKIIWSKSNYGYGRARR